MTIIMRYRTCLQPFFKQSILCVIVFLSFGVDGFSQSAPYAESNFWDKVQFGGGLGLGFGSGFFNATISPTAVYRINNAFSTGAGLNFTYASEKNFYESYVVGASLLALFNPIREIQLSSEFQQSFVSRNYDSRTFFRDEDYWVSALFLGIGFNTGNVTVGIQYDVLFDRERSVFGEAWYPFVRVFF